MSQTRKSTGIDLLRRVLGLGIGRNQVVAFTPAQALTILTELDKVVPRAQRKKPTYKTNPPENLRE